MRNGSFHNYETLGALLTVSEAAIQRIVPASGVTRR
jgi:hypothetical protein